MLSAVPALVVSWKEVEERSYSHILVMHILKKQTGGRPRSPHIFIKGSILFPLKSVWTEVKEWKSMWAHFKCRNMYIHFLKFVYIFSIKPWVHPGAPAHPIPGKYLRIWHSRQTRFHQMACHNLFYAVQGSQWATCCAFPQLVGLTVRTGSDVHSHNLEPCASSFPSHVFWVSGYRGT